MLLGCIRVVVFKLDGLGLLLVFGCSSGGFQCFVFLSLFENVVLQFFLSTLFLVSSFFDQLSFTSAIFLHFSQFIEVLPLKISHFIFKEFMLIIHNNSI